MKKLYKFIFILTASILPCTYRFKFAGLIRYFLAKRFISFCGSNVNFEKGAIIWDGLRIGNNSGVGINSEIIGEVFIGNDVLMGPEVVVYTQNHMHEFNGIPFNRQGVEQIQPVKIGNNVWIGRRAMFMPGSQVGNNVIVAAGAVVTQKFGGNIIIAGVPAKVIKRFNVNSNL